MFPAPTATTLVAILIWVAGMTGNTFLRRWRTGQAVAARAREQVASRAATTVQSLLDRGCVTAEQALVLRARLDDAAPRFIGVDELVWASDTVLEALADGEPQVAVEVAASLRYTPTPILLRHRDLAVALFTALPVPHQLATFTFAFDDVAARDFWAPILNATTAA